MKRKIIKQGHNTLTMTLPAEWAKRFNLEAGKEIDLDEKDNGLFISTERNSKHRVAEFDITSMDVPTIWKYFMAVYREGYDEVKIKFNPQISMEHAYKFYTSYKLDKLYNKKNEKRPIAEVLQAFVNRFVGFEIVEQGKDYVLVREMGEMSGKEFENSLRRVFLIIEQMVEETFDAIKNNDLKLLTHMHDLDINLDKFQDYCIRVLNRTGNKDGKKTSLFFTTLYLLEMAGDEFKNIAFHLLRDGKSMDLKKLEKMAILLKEQYASFYDLFYKFDQEKIKRLSEIDKDIFLGVVESNAGIKEKEREVLHHMRMIERYLNCLIELRIEMEF